MFLLGLLLDIQHISNVRLGSTCYCFFVILTGQIQSAGHTALSHVRVKRQQRVLKKAANSSSYSKACLALMRANLRGRFLDVARFCRYVITSDTIFASRHVEPESLLVSRWPSNVYKAVEDVIKLKSLESLSRAFFRVVGLPC